MIAYERWSYMKVQLYCTQIITGFGRGTTSIQTSCLRRAYDALKFRTAEVRCVNWLSRFLIQALKSRGQTALEVAMGNHNRSREILYVQFPVLVVASSSALWEALIFTDCWRKDSYLSYADNIMNNKLFLATNSLSSSFT